ncbi:MAG: hypothetical protein DRI36_02665 [Caldiserica bacterium]|nr:MAG: hypothetical protein DRI36_02665 [Caldisericota bacterium]
MIVLFFLLSLIVRLKGEIKPEDIIAIYHFDEEEGDRAYDETGKGPEIVLYGAGWSKNGIKGGSIRFYASRYARGVFSSEISLNEITIVVWLKKYIQWLYYYFGNRRCRVSYIVSLCDKDRKYAIAIRGERDSRGIVGECWTAGDIKDNRGYTLNSWHWIAITARIGDKAKLYIDGQLIGESTRNVENFPKIKEIHLSEHFRYGVGNYEQGGYSIEGEIDELYIYSKALSKWELKEEIGNRIFGITVNRKELIIPAEKEYICWGDLDFEERVIIDGILKVDCYRSDWGRGGEIELRVPTVYVSTAGVIDASESGYAGGSYKERAEGPAGGYREQGGGYGGEGANNSGYYGKIKGPEEMGSGGGGNWRSGGGRGGGAIKLVADEIVIDGEIKSCGGDNKQHDYCWAGGGGAGGSIWIEANKISGKGRIIADGGGAVFLGSMPQYASPAYGGGGGRIAIYAQELNFPLENITAYGGSKMVRKPGGAGTIYLNIAGEERLIVKNKFDFEIGARTGVKDEDLSFKEVKISSGSYAYFKNSRISTREFILTGGKAEFDKNSNLEIENELRIEKGKFITFSSVNAGDLIIDKDGYFEGNGSIKCNLLKIKNYGVLTHRENPPNEKKYFIDVEARKIEIEKHGKIDVKGKGYGPTSEGYGARAMAGGTHGGIGGSGAGRDMEAYGLIKEPIELGKAGKNYWSVAKGGRGGGVVKLKAEEMIIDGVIDVSGNNGGKGQVCWYCDWHYTGGGAGGSIWIEAGVLKGEGVIVAKGGNAPSRFGNYYASNSGGGGRIAIYYYENNFKGEIDASGGEGADGALLGGAGTIYLKNLTTGEEKLIVDNRGREGETSIPQGIWDFDRIEIKNKAILRIDKGVDLNVDKIDLSTATLSLNTHLRVKNLYIPNNSILTHSQGKDGFNLEVLEDLIVDGKIDVTGKGYSSEHGPGGGSGAKAAAGGGGYGGKGGDSVQSYGGKGGNSYGSVLYPEDLGSGGGNSWYWGKGGYGGGKIKIKSKNFVINGEVKADGGKGGLYAGGGSGGSIYIITERVEGNGRITANGGNYNGDGGGGGGGRIAIYCGSGEFNGVIEAKGGRGYKNGEDGTIIVEKWGEGPVVSSTLEESFSRESNFGETVEIQKLTLNNYTFSGGDIIGSLEFTGFEKLELKTGAFKDKGFFLSRFTIQIGDESYPCLWNGMFYRKDNKIYLKGAVAGKSYGIMEGIFNEDFSTYISTLSVTQIGNHVVTGKIKLEGNYNVEEVEEYASCGIYYLQKSVKGEITGFYEGKLDITLTHLRIDDENNPYNNKGFAIISFNTDTGEGMGYAYGEKIKDLITEFQGLFSSPLEGLLRGKLDETVSPKVLELSLIRLDYGEEPKPELKIDIWGPRSASPGQTITYTVCVRNDGLKEGRNYSVIAKLPEYSDFVSATEGYKFYRVADWDEEGNYRPVPVVRWDIVNIPAKTSYIFTAQTKLFWGVLIPQRGEAYVIPKDKADEIFPEYDPTGDHD